MKTIVVAALAALALTGCAADKPPVDYEQAHLDACVEQGGVYFEHEDTSAGDHWWCVLPDGAEVTVDGSGG